MWTLGLSSLLLGVCGLVGEPPSALAAQRAFQVDDLFELEDMGRDYGGPYAFSENGQELAYTRLRAKKTLGNFKLEFLWGNAGGDVWVQRSFGQQPINVTMGVKDGSGWWSPQWSPDETKLALLSTRGGNVHLWLWDARTHALRRMTERGVDLSGATRERPYLWVDAGHLLCPLLPGQEQPHSMTVEVDTPRIATREWPKVTRGKESTVSVLDSGVLIDLSKRQQNDLVLIDAKNDDQRSLAHARTRFWQLSPTADALAYARQVSLYTPNVGAPLPFGAGVYTVELVTLEGARIELQGELSRDVLETSMRWSPDGQELAFLGYAGGRDRAPQLYRVSLAKRTVVTQPLEPLDVSPVDRFASPEMEWTGDGRLLLYGAKRVTETRPDVTARRDWWLIDQKGGARIISEGMGKPPQQVWPQADRQRFIGVSEGHIWRLASSGGAPEDLTAHFDGKVARLAWPTKADSKGQYPVVGRTYDRLVFIVQQKENTTPYLLDLNTKEIAPITKPADSAGLAAYEPKTDTAIFSDSGRDGLHVWRTDRHEGRSQLLVSSNEFLRDVAGGEFRPIKYTSLNGAPLKGWVLLPYGYTPGKRYPLIVWVYEGTVYGDIPPRGFGTDSNNALNLQIPAAKGYAVLFPSMPQAPEGIPEDPMLRLPEGVLPAVDTVVELGLADPERLFLMGQSFGGFSTYGLVTQTQRFKAAVTLAGFSDLVSLYGQFDARDRYGEFPQENLFMKALLEGGQISLGGPPWQEWNRYLRNSPIFYVDRAQTPLLIIQGDMDYVALQQGEEFFTSLYRQGKRAQFVRYWGEGHVLESPANIRDMWNRIFAWLEEFSRRKGESAQ